MLFCESQMSSSVYFLSFLVVQRCTAGKPVRGYAEDLGASGRDQHVSQDLQMAEWEVIDLVTSII